MHTITVDLLDRLGFRADDATDFRVGLDLLTPDDHAEIGRLCGLLAANLGRIERRGNLVGGDAAQHPAGLDFPLLVALVQHSPAVVAELMGRGIAEATAWRSVSDLGQQVHIHRLVHGRFGFGARSWCLDNFNGSLLWLGRLQFTLEPETRSLGCHIPEAGPLTPEAVDESLDLARRVALPAWPDFEITGFTCLSWLLDPGLNARLPRRSNIRRFAARFRPQGKGGDATRDALFFGFHREIGEGGRVDLDELPQDTSLQRAIVGQLRDGGVTLQQGWMALA